MNKRPEVICKECTRGQQEVACMVCAGIRAAGWDYSRPCGACDEQGILITLCSYCNGTGWKMRPPPAKLEYMRLSFTGHHHNYTLMFANCNDRVRYIHNLSWTQTSTYIATARKRGWHIAKVIFDEVAGRAIIHYGKTIE